MHWTNETEEATDVPILPLTLPTYNQAMETFQAVYDIESVLQMGLSPLPVVSMNPASTDTGTSNDSMFNLLDEAIETQRPERNELKDYLEEFLSNSNVEVLDYWRDNGHRFPIISEMARKYLGIPATSAGIERVFSITGAIARSRRANISVKHLCNVLLLRQHKQNDLKNRLKGPKSNNGLAG